MDADDHAVLNMLSKQDCPAPRSTSSGPSAEGYQLSGK